MGIVDMIGYTAAAIGAVMFFPQVITLWKTKETKGISSVSFSLLAFVSILWAIYGIMLAAGPIIAVNTMLFLLSTTILILKWKYEKH